MKTYQTTCRRCGRDLAQISLPDDNLQPNDPALRRLCSDCGRAFGGGMLEPDRGAPGTVVVIQSDYPTTMAVSFNGVQADAPTQSTNPKGLGVVVPNGATTGPVTVQPLQDANGNTYEPISVGMFTVPQGGIG